MRVNRVWIGALLLCAAGCSVSISKTLWLDAYDTDGNTSSAHDEAANRELMKHGVTYAFKPGDEIKLTFSEVDSDLVVVENDHTLRVQKPFWLAMTPRGMLVTTDPENAEHDRIQGNVSLGFMMNKAEKENQITLSLRSKPIE